MASADRFSAIYGAINWDVTAPLQCNGCKHTGRSPSAGCYPSSLEHYEAILGPFPEPRTDTRLLILLLDPRPVEKNFTVAAPTTPPQLLRPHEHRYFCLTQHAWKTLGLDSVTRSSTPVWPTELTAHHYLKRYMAGRGKWSYDGFLAYFLYLFRPSAALITDLAKCHFGDAQNRTVYEQCAERHLEAEARLLQPNLILSFTSLLQDGKLISRYVPTLHRVPFLTLYHPAAWKGRDQRDKRFQDQVQNSAAALQSLGHDTNAVCERWRQHVKNAAALR